MRIYKSEYKDLIALSIEYGDYEIKILPDEGGKMASFKKNGHEYLSQSLGDKYKRLTRDSSYIESECSGFDEMFPTIDPMSNGKREYLDHGEVCRMPWEYEIHENRLLMKATSQFNDYVLTKNYTVDCSDKLVISYSALNISKDPLPVIWCAHLMLNAEDGQTVMLPETLYNGEMMFSSDLSLGNRGSVFDIKNGSCLLKSDFKRNDSYKFYINQKIYGKISYGNLKLETENAPYLGVWINNGEFKGMKNIALEVCTGGYDTPENARKHGHDVYINPGEYKEWRLKIYTEEVNK